MKTYLLTPADIKAYHDGADSLIDQIWWDVLNTLPIELFKEAMTKGFMLLDKKPVDDTTNISQKKMILAIPNASPELNAAVEALNVEINFLGSETNNTAAESHKH